MKRDFRLRIFFIIFYITSGVYSGYAGVSRTIQEQYKRDYENKAMFLKIPIYTEKQMIYISGRNFRTEQGTGTPRHKVGDQLRILVVDFANDEIKLRLGGITSPGTVELGFKFDAGLEESFPNRDVFDRALRSTFTEGVSYTDIEDAKRSFVQDEFERSLKGIAASASTSRETVLKTIAPQVPAYQEAQREVENLRDRLQEVNGQLSRSQSENRKLESELKHQQSDISRLNSANKTLQEKIESSASQVSRLGEELKDARGSAQGYQKELANIQRSLNLRVDTSRDLSSQIADLGQAMRSLQKENQNLGNQINSLRTDLNAQQTSNARLVSENEELKAGNRKMQSTISVLTSKEDSLAKKYVTLTGEKEKLDDFSRSIKALRAQVVEEKLEGGVQKGKANIYLNAVLLGLLEWSVPAYLDNNQSRNVEAVFSAESIDRVKLTPEERHILHSLGDRLKIRVDLASASDSMNITAEEKEQLREIPERERSDWRWNLTNRGIQDGQLVLTASFINKDSNEIPVFRQDHPIAASNLVRQVRGHLQPIPLATGAVIGFLLFGIVSVFKRSKGKGSPRTKPAVPAPHEPTGYAGKKQL